MNKAVDLLEITMINRGCVKTFIIERGLKLSNVYKTQFKEFLNDLVVCVKKFIEGLFRTGIL